MTPSTHTLAFCLNFSSEFEPACLSLDWLIVPEYVCTASCVYLLVKMLVWVCFPACTWISGVGYSRHEQSRIKSIFILARQQSVLLLGDAATQREEGEKKNKPSFSFFYPHHLFCLAVLHPPALSLLLLVLLFFISPLHSCFFLFYYPVLSPPLSTPRQ